MLVDARGGACFVLRPQTVLDELAELHRLAPRATIEALEVEELDGRGIPTWTAVAWIWRPRHRLAKAAARDARRTEKRPAR